MRLFSNRSQMTSKCGKNKKVTCFLWKKEARTMALLVFLCQRRDFVSFVSTLSVLLLLFFFFLFRFFFFITYFVLLVYRFRSKYHRYIFLNLPPVSWRWICSPCYLTSLLGFSSLSFYFPTKITLLNAAFFPVKCWVSPKKVPKFSVHTHYKWAMT